MITEILWNLVYNCFTALFVKMNHVNPIETGRITDNLFVIRTDTANFYIYKTDSGLISFSQVGNKIYYKLSDVEELLKTHYNKAFKK